MRPAVDVVTTLRYRFVRYCVNKAYAEMELQECPRRWSTYLTTS